MKFGIRRPSIRKRIAARTSVKRVIRHNLGLKAPRSYGWITNPRKAAYNHIYNRTTRGCGTALLTLASLLVLIILAGCQLAPSAVAAPSSTPQPPTASPTQPPTATLTATPTLTPTTTPTPAPTETPTATPTSAPVVREDGFTVYTFAEDGYQIALPPDWERIDLDPERMKDSLDKIGKTDPTFAKTFGEQTINSFLQNIWVVDILWGWVYLADYYLTIYTARQFQTALKEHISFEGSFELTPAFQKDVDQLRLFSRTFLLRLLLSILLISLVWWLSVQALGLPQFYFFAAGVLFLREAVVVMRHGRNVALILFSRDGDHLHGSIGYSRCLTLRLYSAEIASFGLFFFLISIGVGSWFFLGGSVACMFTASSHYRISRKLQTRGANLKSASA